MIAMSPASAARPGAFVRLPSRAVPLHLRGRARRMVGRSSRPALGHGAWMSRAHGGHRAPVPPRRDAEWRILRGFEQLFGMSPGGLVARVGAQHAAQLLHELRRARAARRRRGPRSAPARAASRSGCACLTTRKWRSASDATCGRWVMQSTWRPRRQRAQPLPDRARRGAAHARVDLVEHDGRRALRGGGDAHQREHHARQLAAGGDLAQRARRHARVRARSGTRRSRRRSAPKRASGPSPALGRASIDDLERRLGHRELRRAPRTPPSRAPPPPCRTRAARRRARQLVERGRVARPAPPRAGRSSRSAFASRSRSARQRSACSSTAAIVPPCLRFSRASCSRRSSTTARRPGSASSEPGRSAARAAMSCSSYATACRARRERVERLVAAPAPRPARRPRPPAAPSRRAVHRRCGSSASDAAAAA